MMERYLSDHGFIAIDNQAGVSYDNKFFAGKAEELEAEVKHIMGAKQAWKGHEKQLESLMTGKYKKRADNLSKLKKTGLFNKKQNSVPSEKLD